MIEAVQRRRGPAAWVGLSVALMLPALLSAGGPGVLPAESHAVSEVLVNEAVVWTLTIAILAIVVFWERRPLSSIGLVRPTAGAFLAGAAVMGAIMVSAMVAAVAIRTAGFPVDNDAQARLVIGLPVWLQMFVAVSAGVTEEILFRGYAVERATELTGSRWLGALLPVIVFGGVHAPFWGAAHAFVAGFEGLLLTIVYLWRRNLWTNITAHALLDGLVLAVADIAAHYGTTDI